MFTYNFIISRKGILYLQLFGNYKKIQMSLRIKMSSEYLTLAQSPKKRGEPTEIASLRKLLRTYNLFLENLQKRIPEGGRSSLNLMEIRAEFEEYFGFVTRKPQNKEPELGTFVTQFQKFIDSKDNAGTKGVYKHTLDKIRAFDSKIDKKTFEDIDLRWLTEFEAFCAKTASKNARNIHLRNIRAVFNKVIDFEITTAYPFRRFKIRPEETRKRSLSVEELRAFIGMEVEDYQQFYKDMFLLSFYLIGCNAVDMYGLSEITSDNRIKYTRAKTHRKYSIKVEPEALEIINKYRGKGKLLCIADRWSDHRNFVHQLNKALKTMGQVERVGRGGKKIRTPAFPELSSYWCRHTWATLAYNCCGISEDVIAQALGHASSHTTTSIYINRSTKLVDEANRKVIDYVFNKS